MNSGFFINKILFIGDDNKASIDFSNHLHIVHGASNTGKSLLIEAIDYMFGSEELKEVKPESEKYSEVAMQLYLNSKPYTVFRKWPSNSFEIYHDFVEEKDGANFYSYFKVGKETKTVKNISDFYLSGLRDVEISSNLYGEKSSLTIRLLSRVFFSSEEKIISSNSPIVVGDTSEDSKNKNIFKFLLTGNDDSNVKTVVRGNEFKSEKKGQLDVLRDVVETLQSDLMFKDESYEDLKEREVKLDSTIEKLNHSMSLMKESLSEVVKNKRNIANELISVDERNDNIKSNLANFEILEKIYISDIERLSSQEEAAFLLGVGHHAQCEHCGKTPEKICEDLMDVEKLAKSSQIEIKKIKYKLLELNETRLKLKSQLDNYYSRSQSLSYDLKCIDDEVENRTPEIKIIDEKISELTEERNLVLSDIRLLERINIFYKRLQETEVASTPKKYKSHDFYPENEAVDNFCRIYKDILNQINFPGNNEVSFDFSTFDVVIDGKPRSLNGKGVRAILHSVFKIALLKHCKESSLYHPGIIVLDSPLVTYRDPFKSKHGDLDDDEKELANTKVSYHFLKYLTENNIGQFIIVENIDIPDSLTNSIGVDTFYGNDAENGQRAGLL
ncbi:AAA family ATPase [Vibrio alginolyticus]|uniref:AAA family ATPase n=1 Tax=Vibrio alginolyticus TaxID=663 RepID=UPI001BD2CBE1|nr:AAA family ATPase [Vibrio alginolyticus]ELC9556765.1 AAA family ATPase [Vibrio alginolyticus]MBS9842883.1 AAA family ATPase [Vibrio alginolyticus]MBY7957815.1 AAA family ATPase [Vibrio fluvialis]